MEEASGLLLLIVAVMFGVSLIGALLEKLETIEPFDRWIGSIKQLF